MKFLGVLAALVVCAAVSQAQSPVVGTVTALRATRNQLTVEFSEAGKLLPQFYTLDTTNPDLKLALDGSPVTPAALIAASLSASLSLTFTPDPTLSGGTNSMAFTTLKAGAVAPVTQYAPGPQAVPVTQFLPAAQPFAASACGATIQASACGSAATSAAGTCSSASASAGGCGQAQSARRGLFGRFR